MLVSIIIPVHRTISYFKTCVESALSQTYQDIEILLACNGALEIEDCKFFINSSDSRITYLKTKNGRHNARNEALLIAQGRFVQFLDYDDFLYPNKLTVQLELIKNNFDSHISITKWKKFTIDINENYIFPYNLLFNEEYISTAKLIQKLGQSGGFIATSSWIVSRELLTGILWVDSPNDDAVFFSEICKKKPNIFIIQEILAGCRIHQDNTSTIRSKEQFNLLLKSWNQIYKNLQTIENSNVELYIYKAYLYLILYSRAIKKYRIWEVIYKSLLFGYKAGVGLSIFRDIKKQVFN